MLGGDAVAEPQRGALPPVHRADDGVVTGFPHELGGPVLLAVDDDDEGDRLPAEFGRQRLDDPADVVDLVVRRGDDDDLGEPGVAVGGAELVERDRVDELVKGGSAAGLPGVHLGAFRSGAAERAG